MARVKGALLGVLSASCRRMMSRLGAQRPLKLNAVGLQGVLKELTVPKATGIKPLGP